MKALHRDDLFGWSQFDEQRNLDFHSLAWIRPAGNVLVDPLEMSEHDLLHLNALGGASLIVITNRDHLRAASALADALGADLLGPVGEQDTLPIECARWLTEGDEIVPGLKVLEMHGSKTPGELALLLEETTLITGDLIRGHRAGRLNLLPDAKLVDKERAVASVRRLLELPRVDAVLVGDGWPVFRDGQARLRELVANI
ncbi:MAG TPA: MBL fold metallo-hydrolase [Myxococcaceae bacterium]|nr:MBL fold metallo-hydrolase [Myxococcaceae bacterium]